MSETPGTPWNLIVEKLRAATAGEFVIGGELGHGGMAAVFLGHDIKLNRRVAIKVMSPALLMGEGMVQRFVDEAVMMANLRHPNIITVHSVREADDLHFFVMQFVSGRSLDHILKHARALPVETVQAILWQVGSALGYAHRHGVIHRDIKPANILMDEDGYALVTDFGIAKAAESSAHTQTGVLIGTPAYMSPEQCYGSGVTAASDQYSLGVVAFEMLTGMQPFSGSNFTVMQAHTMHPPPALRSIRPDLPASIEQAVLRMLAKTPQERWPSIREALAALEAKPLDENDPVRSKLARLATLGDAPAATQQGLTPVASRSTGPSRDATPAVARADTPATPAASKPVSLLMTAPPAQVEVGDSFRLEAFVCSEGGTILSTYRTTWSSSDHAVATVSERGDVTALAPGEVTLSVSAAGLTEHATVVISPPGVAGVDIHLPSGPIRVGDRVKLSATPRDKHSTPVPQPVTWASENKAVAMLSGGGVLTALTPGEAVVVAEAAGVRGTAKISVLAAPVASVELDVPVRSLPEGETIQLRALPRDGGGRALPDRVVTWTSSAGKTVSVTEAGEVAGIAVGSATITARCEDKVAATTVTVTPRVVTSLVLSAPPAELLPGKKFRLSATALDSRGATLERFPEWRTSAESVARVTQKGDITLRAPGRATITAKIERVEASVELVVSAPVRITPALEEAAAVDDRREADGSRLRPVLIGVGGALVVAFGVAWLLTRGAGDRSGVDSVGPRTGALVTGATASAKDVPPKDTAKRPDSGTLSVSTPLSVVLATKRGSIVVGDSIFLEVRISGGDPSRTRSALNWKSKSPAVASVSTRGWVRGLTAGVASVIATSDERADTAQITVTAAPARVAAVTISPNKLVLKPNESATLHAAPMDDRSNVLADRPVVWRSSDAQVARVDPATGIVTGGVPGQASITATSDGVAGSLVVSVEKIPDKPVVIVDHSDSNRSPPIVSPPVITRFSALVAGGAWTCGVTDGGTATCWGAGQSTPAAAGGRAMGKISVGKSHRCGIASGTAYCWGANNDGQLGDGSTTAHGTPTSVSGGIALVEISAGGSHTCGLDAAGVAYCWGANDMGQLGDGSTKASRTPIKVKSPAPFKAIVAGKAHTCALTADGRGYCWGDGWSGALGNGIKAAQSAPFPIAGDIHFKKLVLGDEHTCGLTTTGKAFCWGDNRKGQDGDSRTSEKTKPTEVARLPEFLDIAAGGYHSCGVTTSNRIFCWGANDKGQLGNGSTASEKVPVEVKSEERFESVSAGAAHTCAISRERAPYCWGDNAQGQVGDGTTTAQTTPVPVKGKGS
jgi:serine/threonine protein kinase/alpha-tubulin suppressor-like RCC1 family protein/uncharacterized protein YjdB